MSELPFVPHSPYRRDRVCADGGELLAQAADLHGYRRVVGVAAPSEHGFANLRTAHDLAGMAGQVLADGVLGGRERHGRPADGKVAGSQIEAHVAEREGVRMGAALPTQVRGDLGAQFGRAEGLADVVVCAQAVAADGVLFGDLGGEEEDGAVEKRPS